MSTAPITYATDEDILVIAGSDFATVVPRFAKYARGRDGVFDPAGWQLSSPTVNFAAQGVVPSMVCEIHASVGGGGDSDLLIVDSVQGNTIVLRRPGEPSLIGLPPGQGIVLPPGKGVSFVVMSMRNQIAECAKDIDDQLAIDDRIPNRTRGDEYDLHVMRPLVVYETIARQYENMERDEHGDFPRKAVTYRTRYDQQLDRTVVRWGPQGQSQESTTRFSTRLSR